MRNKNIAKSVYFSLQLASYMQIIIRGNLLLLTATVPPVTAKSQTCWPEPSNNLTTLEMSARVFQAEAACRYLKQQTAFQYSATNIVFPLFSITHRVSISIKNNSVAKQVMKHLNKNQNDICNFILTR